MSKKKFKEHLEKELNKRRMICMCKIHKKRVAHCGCENPQPFSEETDICIWGEYDYLINTNFFSEEEVKSAVADYFYPQEA